MQDASTTDGGAGGRVSIAEDFFQLGGERVPVERFEPLPIVGGSEVGGVTADDAPADAVDGEAAGGSKDDRDGAEIGEGSFHDADSTVRLHGAATVREPLGVRVGHVVPDGLTAESWRAQFDPARFPLRLPASVMPAPGAPCNTVELEDWIIGAYIVNYYRVHRCSPNMRQIEYLSGRSHKRVRAVVERLHRKGWIGCKRLRNEYQPGLFGLQWRFWIPAGSPLAQLKDAKPGDGFRWIAVPGEVARYRSVLATAAYLVLHEQMRRDGAIVTTPADLAGLLQCGRTTAWRILRFVGARTVTELRSKHTVYAMDLPLGPSTDAHDFYYGTFYAPLFAPARSAERLLERLRGCCNILANLGVNVSVELREVYQEIDRSAQPSIALFTRVLEERNRRLLMGHDTYSRLLPLRMGWKLKGLRRSAFKIRTSADQDERARIRRAIHNELQTADCDKCDGTGFQMREEYDAQVGYYVERATPCRCRT